MQELEKILEEIEEATRQEDAPIYCGNMEVDGYVRMSVVEEIIRKRMNDGWISVEERLPEDETMMLVTCQTKAGRRSVNRAWYGAGCWHGTGSMSGVTAWMPLPEPYSPERSSNEEE